MLHRQPHPPSPARLLLTPRISTALAHLVSRIAEAAGAPELIRLTVLLPTAGALHDLRRRLGDTMGVRMLQFYRLGVAVLDEAGIPVHEINDAAVRRLLRRILGELHDEERLPTFDPLFDKQNVLWGTMVHDNKTNVDGFRVFRSTPVLALPSFYAAQVTQLSVSSPQQRASQ